MSHTFKDLKVWQHAHRFVLEIYRVTKKFPEEEKYGLISQVRRAAVSVPANIVEGAKRQSRRDFAHFTNIAAASLEEAKYYVLLAKDLEYIPDETGKELDSQCEEIAKMLFGLHHYLKN